MSEITDQVFTQDINTLVSQMIPLFSCLIRTAGVVLMVTTLVSGFSKFLAYDGDPRRIIPGILGSLMIGSLSFGLSSLFEGFTSEHGDNSNSPSPFDSLPLKVIGIGLGISIIIIMASLVAWRFSKPWRDKRATEKGHQKVMREIWCLRSRIADGAFDEQGLDILNALAYVEDSLITFKVYKAEATQAEQINLLKEVKPKLNEIITRFGNAWKDTAIDNALKNISMFNK